MEQQTFLIYNVTNKISHNIHQDWLKWMRDHHMPTMLATGCFFKASILRLKGVDDEEGPTYVIQYHTSSEAEYNRYLANFSIRLRQETIDKWGNQFIAFRTIMEVVN